MFRQYTSFELLAAWGVAKPSVFCHALHPWILRTRVFRICCLRRWNILLTKREQMHLETSSNLYDVTTNSYNRALTFGDSSGEEGSLIRLRGSCLGIGSDIGRTSTSLYLFTPVSDTPQVAASDPQQPTMGFMIFVLLASVFQK